ncbi:flagella synthesis protein FlgN [Candidatus Contendibacter odensensis]|uniref:FlgN domain protein n=1 Tax=Candidatus Contendobacter odensis Run_B_J11 TaxID=1400861 RepID=A0A7U7G8A7_9GAMM|nr:flagellar protein FlgN [Candidatus Contendobacter odensis]CDH43770.1 putative flgN domain protein [Candidatus Contendobacter odensis Run_B_J11]
MLATLLREETVAVEALAQQLRCEYEVLKTRDAPELEQILREKLVCADQLRKLIAARLDFLRDQGFAADRQGFIAYIAAVSPDTRSVLSTLAVELENAAEQARNQNEINGAVIAASRSYIERALTILSGRDPLDCLYDQGTRKIFSGGHTPIAKA